MISKWFRKTAKDYLEEGTLQSMRGEYKRAVKTLSKAIELDSGLAEAYMHRGIAYLESGRGDLALQDFGRSLRLETDGLCYYNRALAWLETGDIENALRDLDEAIRLKPQDGESYTLRAIVHSRRGKFNLALEDIERAIDVGHASGYRNKAIILEKAGRLDEAVRYWEICLQMETRNATFALARRGLLLEWLGREREALGDLERVWQKRRDLPKRELKSQVEDALSRPRRDE